MNIYYDDELFTFLHSQLKYKYHVTYNIACRFVFYILSNHEQINQKLELVFITVVSQRHTFSN